MKLGIIGAGMIVNDFLSMANTVDNLELIAITGSRSIEKLQKLAEENNIGEYYVDIDEMLKSNNFDTAYIALPNNLHFEYCKMALENNKNIICEKPFTSNISELMELIDLAKSKNLMIIEAVTTHYLPNTIEIYKQLTQIGNLKIINMNYSQYSSRYKAFQEGNIQPAFDANKSGGALMDLNIYNINFIVGAFGKPNEIEYYPNIEKGIDTSGILIITYDTFKCVLIGAKDCSAPINSTIQGDKGYISIKYPVNMLNGFSLINSTERRVQNNSSNEEINLNDNKHRMYYEFVEFIKIFEEKDYTKMNEMLDISIIVMDIQTQARKKAGIIFAADKN